MKRLIAIGGSDSVISAALRAREIDPAVEITVVVADQYPNFSHALATPCLGGALEGMLWSALGSDQDNILILKELLYKNI
jgi:hypothetical protein